MSNITPFIFESHPIRAELDDQGMPWFNANDVCEALELTNPHKAIGDHVDADDLTKREVIDNLGRKQLANYINESGLYALIMGSTKDSAKRFKRWVTSEVLPSIRKTGAYVAPTALPDPERDIETTAAALLGDGFSVFHNRLKYQGQDLQKVASEFNACLRAADLAARHLAITDQDWILAHAMRNLRLTTGIDMRVLTGARTLIPYSDDLLSPEEIGYELGFVRHPAKIVNWLLAEIGYQEPLPKPGHWSPIGPGHSVSRTRATEITITNPHDGSTHTEIRAVLYWQPAMIQTLRDFLRDLSNAPAAPLVPFQRERPVH